MDGIVQIGPLMMATDRLIAVVAVWAFVAIASIIAVRMDSRAVRAGWIAALVGVVAARIGYILSNLDAFMTEPWTMLAIWQGGFSSWVGVGAAAIVIAIILGRSWASLVMIGALGSLALAHSVATSLLAPDVRPMPVMALENLAGSETELGVPGQPMVINLWATWCPPCRREMPMLIDVAQDSDVPILLVNQGESAATISTFLAQQGLAEGAILTDPESRLGQAIASPALPTTLFVDGTGNIVDLHTGEISRAALTAAIRQLQRTQ